MLNITAMFKKWQSFFSILLHKVFILNHFSNVSLNWQMWTQDVKFHEMSTSWIKSWVSKEDILS